MNIIDKLGIDAIKPYIPFDIPTLMRYYLDGDINFDKTNIRIWENASELFKTSHREISMFDCSIGEYGLEYLLRNNGIKNTPLSKRVEVLKETARILCERKKGK